MVARLSDLRMQLSSMEKQRADAAAEHEEVAGGLSDARVREASLREDVRELEEAASAAGERRRAIDEELSAITADERAARGEADRETLAYAKLEDQIASAEVEDQMFASRLEQLDETVRTTEEAVAERTERAEDLEAALSDARERESGLATAIAGHAGALSAARDEHAEAQRALSSATATLDALRAVDTDVELASPLVAALAADEARVRCRLADLVDADPAVESLVERLLGDDLAALVVAGSDDVTTLVERALSMADKGRRGRDRLDGARRARPRGPGRPGHAARLAPARLRRGPPAARGPSRQRAPGGRRRRGRARPRGGARGHLRHRGRRGRPADGRVRVGAAPSSEAGALERKRRIRELTAGMGALEERLGAAADAVSEAEARLAAAREQEAAAKGEIARLRAELTSATSERGRLEAQLASAISERAQVTKRRASAAERAAAAREQIEQHRGAARAARERADELAGRLAERTAEHDAAVRAQGTASKELSDGRLELAMTSERRAALERRERELSARVAELDQRIEATRRSSRSLEVVRLRVDPLHDRMDAVRARALEWAARLKDRASLAEADSDSLKRTIGDARVAVSEATAELESARAAATEVKVDLGKLEVQVQTAVNAIVATGAVLDEALECSPPDDRDEAERRAASLRSQIESIGPVNAVAMDEYLRLKERYDYIDEQVTDLEDARAALRKITAAIDRKMRNRFLAVFERVNANFAEIFALLFPGGQAHIEMTDPDNPGETGIEIVAQPRGKKIAKMMLMSGGEKSLTALALLFAVYKVRTVPFYVFDEVEAALDDSNLSKLLDAIERLKESTQLIVISHQRRTMEQADVLYGVSMQADGVSHVVSQRLDRATGKVVDA